MDGAKKTVTAIKERFVCSWTLNLCQTSRTLAHVSNHRHLHSNEILNCIYNWLNEWLARVPRRLLQWVVKFGIWQLFHIQGGQGYYNSLILQALELPPWTSGSYVPNCQGKTTFLKLWVSSLLVHCQYLRLTLLLAEKQIGFQFFFTWTLQTCETPCIYCLTVFSLHFHSAVLCIFSNLQ